MAKENMLEINKIYNEDCMVVMKRMFDNSVDLIITDPPYKLTARGNYGNTGGMFRKKEVKNGKVFSVNNIEIETWLPELYRVLKQNSHCYIMTNNKNITKFLSVINESDFHFIKCLIWVKDNKIMGQTYMSQFEYIIMLRKGKHKRINNCGTSDVLVYPNKKSKDSLGKNINDTEKPLGLIEVLVENSSVAKDIVLDPFMGSGTTGVACKKLNREFIGIEIAKRDFDFAQSRINQV